jgi:hypothetical protein
MLSIPTVVINQISILVSATNLLIHVTWIKRVIAESDVLEQNYMQLIHIDLGDC